MIYIVFSDRLGNNLFQFATALTLSSEITICVPLADEYKATLKYRDTFFKGFVILNYIPEGIEIYEEPFYHYQKIPYRKHQDLVIRGYFQSYKYINRDLVLDQFSFSPQILNFLKSNYSEIQNSNYTSIHVRRGDYLKLPYKHPFCGLRYYKKAIKLIGKNEKFVVTSDDIQWCKKHLKLSNVIFIENTSPIIDMCIQSLCKNNIISNSSFSWWAAYLNKNNNKVVIAPSYWFGFNFKVNTKDLLPESYIIIQNKYRIGIFAKSLYLLTKNKINRVVFHNE